VNDFQNFAFRAVVRSKRQNVYGWGWTASNFSDGVLTSFSFGFSHQYAMLKLKSKRVLTRFFLRHRYLN
jgi:hypothetical protein